MALLEAILGYFPSTFLNVTHVYFHKAIVVCQNVHFQVNNRSLGVVPSNKASIIKLSVRDVVLTSHVWLEGSDWVTTHTSSPLKVLFRRFKGRPEWDSGFLSADSSKGNRTFVPCWKVGLVVNRSISPNAIIVKFVCEVKRSALRRVRK